MAAACCSASATRRCAAVSTFWATACLTACSAPSFTDDATPPTSTLTAGLVTVPPIRMPSGTVGAALTSRPAAPAFETSPAIAWLAALPMSERGTLSPSAYCSDWSSPFEPLTVMVVPATFTVNGCMKSRPSRIWNAARSACIVGLSRNWSLVTSTTFSSAGKSCNSSCVVWRVPPPVSPGKSGSMFLPRAPFTCRSVDTLPMAYFATGASACTVAKASNAEGMSTFIMRKPTSNAGLVVSTVS